MLGCVVERKENAYVVKRKIMLRLYSSLNPVKNLYCSRSPSVNIAWLPGTSGLGVDGGRS